MREDSDVVSEIDIGGGYVALQYEVVILAIRILK